MSSLYLLLSSLPLEREKGEKEDKQGIDRGITVQQKKTGIRRN